MTCRERTPLSPADPMRMHGAISRHVLEAWIAGWRIDGLLPEAEADFDYDGLVDDLLSVRKNGKQ